MHNEAKCRQVGRHDYQRFISFELISTSLNLFRNLSLRNRQGFVVIGFLFYQTCRRGESRYSFRGRSTAVILSSSFIEENINCWEYLICRVQSTSMSVKRSVLISRYSNLKVKRIVMHAI